MPLPGAAAGPAGKCEMIGFADLLPHTDANQLGAAFQLQNPNLHLRTGMGRKWYKPQVLLSLKTKLIVIFRILLIHKPNFRNIALILICV